MPYEMGCRFRSGMHLYDLRILETNKAGIYQRNGGVMNRPLSKEERAKYAEFLGDGTDDRAFLNQQWAQRLLESERFWREAVKNLEVPPSEYCPFCDRMLFTIHKPDCAYMLAQES